MGVRYHIKQINLFLHVFNDGVRVGMGIGSDGKKGL